MRIPIIPQVVGIPGHSSQVENSIRLWVEVSVVVLEEWAGVVLEEASAADLGEVEWGMIDLVEG